MYDVIIIGGGPAGMSAAIYTARRGQKTLVISQDIGGQASKANEVENYPGLGITTGVDLSKSFFNQARQFKTEFLFDEVMKIEEESNNFTISTRTKKLNSHAIILAFGKKPKELGVPGEEALKGHGVSYCATCDAPFFKDKIVAVTGSGNSAVDATIACATVAKKVYIITRKDVYYAEETLIERMKGLKNVTEIRNSEIGEIKGDKKVESIILKDGKEIATDGVIVEIGYAIDRKIIEGLVDLDEKGQVIVDQYQKTSVDGIFAAGDITNSPYKQIVIAAGEGAKAALSCFTYIQKNKK